MKRQVSDSDTRQTARHSACSAKRRKTQCGDVSAPPLSSPPPSDPSSQTLAFVQRWVEDCPSTCNSEMMAAPPTPRSAYGNDRGRRSTRRSHGSRTPSPSKKPSPQTYRNRNMHHAGAFVDKLGELPSAIDKEVRRILGITSWEEQVPAIADGPQTQLAATYSAESRRNARDCLLEGDWKATLNGLLRNLADLPPHVLRTHTSEKIWNSDLKPTAPSLNECPNDNDGGTHTPRSALLSQTALPDFNPSVEAADPYYISTPKPDITVGLAHTAFLSSHQRRLVDHQAFGTILSDPHAAEMGIRFPFLIIEAKGMSLTGSLISAQNQAAISGASMLRILQDLSHQAGEVQTSDPELTALSTTPALCFSVVTEGPVHELWVHFELEGAYHMEFVESWRTTRERDARELVQFLAQIMVWGKGIFKDCIVKKLEKVPGYGVLG